MLQPTIQNIKWEQLNFLRRVYGDLEAADGFIGITKEQIFMLKASEALDSSLKQLLVALLDELPKEKSMIKSGDPMGAALEALRDKGYNNCLSEITQIIKKNLEEL